MFKGLVALLVLVFAGGWLVGAFGTQAYSRTVSRPPAQVMAALERLDLTAEPGAPGSTAAAAGGVKPLFRLARQGDRMTWYVMSGDKVATTMTATFEPVDEGRATLIRTFVERGDAPDDFVSPAFRSKGLTMALFGMAIEGQVNRLVQPAAASPEDCQKLLDGFTDAGIARFEAGAAQRPEGFRQGMAEGAKNIMRLHAMEAELRRNGCDTDGNSGAFRPVESQMTATDTGDGAPAMTDGNTTGALGQPMMDPTPSR